MSISLMKYEVLLIIKVTKKSQFNAKKKISMILMTKKEYEIR